MAEKANIVGCALCDRMFHYGPGKYDGRYVRRYGMLVCNGCWNGNGDGWSPMHEPSILEVLAKQKLPVPSRNEKGLLPRD